MDVDTALILESLGAARKFADPGSPLPGRMMAAGGTLPLPPGQIATVLYCLTLDPEEQVRENLEKLLELDRGFGRQPEPRAFYRPPKAFQAVQELPAETADCELLLRAVKRAFDPKGILNPGKMQDAPDDWLTATELRYRTEV